MENINVFGACFSLVAAILLAGFKENIGNAFRALSTKYRNNVIEGNFYWAKNTNTGESEPVLAGKEVVSLGAGAGIHVFLLEHDMRKRNIPWSLSKVYLFESMSQKEIDIIKTGDFNVISGKVLACDTAQYSTKNGKDYVADLKTA